MATDHDEADAGAGEDDGPADDAHAGEHHGPGDSHEHGHGHDDHGAPAPESSAWVLAPLAVGLFVAVVLLIVFGLHTGATPA